MKRLITLLIILSSFLGFSQNLVSNGSFEEYSECPEFSDEVHKAIGWQKLHHTSDYFNCDHQSSEIDTMGHTGSAYIGMSCLRPGWSNDYREYVSRYLDEPLQAGVSYYVEFWVKSEGDRCVGTDAFGALFSQGEPVHVDSWTSLLPYTPQIENEQYNQIDNTWEWKKICGTFVAEGGEDFITLGSFKSDEESTFNLIDTVTCTGGSHVHWSYVLLDDIVVEVDTGQGDCPIVEYAYPVNVIDPDGGPGFNAGDDDELEPDCQIELANVITPNGDMINDELVIDLTGNWEFVVVNRWGEQVYRTNGYYGYAFEGNDLSGEPLNDGTYFYLLQDYSNGCQKHGTITIAR